LTVITVESVAFNGIVRLKFTPDLINIAMMQEEKRVYNQHLIPLGESAILDILPPIPT
jgi:hypothetical protein